MGQFEEKLDKVADELQKGDEILFHYPYVGCTKEGIKEYLENRLGVPVSLEDGVLSFTLIGKIERIK